MFRLIAPNDDHSFVQVLSADGQEIYGLFFTLPVERAPLQSQAEVRFAESAAGVPPAIQALLLRKTPVPVRIFTRCTTSLQE